MARGIWDPDSNRFETLLTTDLEEYECAIVGTWMPVARSFTTKAEAEEFIQHNEGPSAATGMRHVRNGVFSTRWYQVTDQAKGLYTIVHDSTMATELVQMNPVDRKMQRVPDSRGWNPGAREGIELQFIPHEEFDAA